MLSPRPLGTPWPFYKQRPQISCRITIDIVGPSAQPLSRLYLSRMFLQCLNIGAVWSRPYITHKDFSLAQFWMLSVKLTWLHRFPSTKKPPNKMGVTPSLPQTCTLPAASLRFLLCNASHSCILPLPRHLPPGRSADR